MGELKDEIVSEIKTLLEEVESKNKEKKFKFPFGKKVGKRQGKKNYVTILRINENNVATFKKLQIDEQTIMDEGIPRLAASQYVMMYKGNPLIILPSWSTIPFSPADHYEKSLNDGSNTKGYQILMNKMLKETVGMKKKMGGIGPWIIGAIVLIVIGYALLTGGG